MKEILLLQLAYYHVFWAAQLLVTQAWVKVQKISVETMCIGHRKNIFLTHLCISSEVPRFDQYLL